MRISFQLRAGLFGLIAIVGSIVSSAAFADGGIIRITVLKGAGSSGAPPAAER
jgi:hypothetical protein